MAKAKKLVTVATATSGAPIQVPVIEPGTPEMEALLSVGYGMTVEEAKQIIAERDKDPRLHTYEVYVNAKAMLAAFNAKPKAVSSKPAWKRTIR